MTELRPCPFCGGRADWDSKPGATGEQFWCLCLNHGCAFYNAEPFCTYARADEAVAAWNKRTADPSAADTIARLTAALRECEAALKAFLDSSYTAARVPADGLWHDSGLGHAIDQARNARAAAKQALGEGP